MPIESLQRYAFTWGHRTGVVERERERERGSERERKNERVHGEKERKLMCREKEDEVEARMERMKRIS